MLKKPLWKLLDSVIFSTFDMELIGPRSKKLAAGWMVLLADILDIWLLLAEKLSAPVWRRASVVNVSSRPGGETGTFWLTFSSFVDVARFGALCDNALCDVNNCTQIMCLIRCIAANLMDANGTIAIQFVRWALNWPGACAARLTQASIVDMC